MSVDLSELILYSPDNAFKNASSYSGTIVFPTSLSTGQNWTGSFSVNLSVDPVYSMFYAYFQEFFDATLGNSAQWYPANVSGYFNIGIYVNSPTVNAGWISCGIYYILNGNTIKVVGNVQNPYSNSITLNALSVPCVFIDYTLAN